MTTDGIANDNNIDNKPTANRPLLIRKTGFFFESFFLNRQKISLPIVIALTKLIESIVDIIIAKIDIRNSPKNTGGNTSDPKSGYVITGFSGMIKIYAYSPAVNVIKSNKNQKHTEINKPFFAISGFLTAAHLWKKFGSMIVHAAIKNHTITYCIELPPKGSRWLSGKDLSSIKGETELYQEKPINVKNPKNINTNCK